MCLCVSFSGFGQARTRFLKNCVEDEKEFGLRNKNLVKIKKTFIQGCDCKYSRSRSQEHCEHL